jgi:type IV secretion system protein VirB9
MWSVAIAVVAIGCAQVGKNPDVAGVKPAVRVVEKPVPVMPVQVRGANFELLPATDPAIVEAMKQLEETGGAPRIEREGFIYAPYDGDQTNIACKPTRICRIELAVGEVPKPNGVILGDSARWFAGVGSHGSGDRQVYSVFVKPIFTDSPDSTKCSHETNLIVQTDLRTYQFGLLCSDMAPYTRMLRFYYPDEVKVAWALGAAEIEQQSPRASAKSAREADGDALPSVGAANFDGYTIGGAKARWRPVRAFDDGAHMRASSRWSFPRSSFVGRAASSSS